MPFTYPHPRFPVAPFFPFPLSFTFFSSQRSPPWECDCKHSLLCCIAFAQGHMKTAEKLCRYSRPFHRVCPQSKVSEKMTSRSVFRYAGGHPSKYWPSAKVLDLGDRLVPDTYDTPNAVGAKMITNLIVNFPLNGNLYTWIIKHVTTMKQECIKSIYLAS